MTVGHSSAIEQALALLRAPALLAALRQRPLPEDLPQLFRLAAGDVDLFEQIESATGESRAQLAEAATFYLQQVLFAPGADSYRVLGVAPDAADEQIKQHYRQLLRWLHPDRNRDEWDAVYADRVNRAWHDLRTPERRAEYDRRPSPLPETVAAAHTAASGGFRARPMPPVDTPVLSSRAVRRLPWLVLGSLGLLATAVLGGAWYLQRLESTGTIVQQTAVRDVATHRPETPATPATEIPPTADESPVVKAPPAELSEAPEDLPTRVDDNRAEALPLASLMAAATTQASPPPSPSRAERATRAAAEPVAIVRPEPAVQAPREPESTSIPAMSVAAPPEPAPVARAASMPASVVASDAAIAATEETPATHAVDPAPTPAAPVLGEREAMALLEQFQRSYGAGDLQSLMRLFTGDARNNRGGLAAISKDYEQLFRSTDSRRIEWREPVWLGSGARGSVSARYLATVLPSGELRPNIVEGDIRFDLRLEGDAARIERVRHQ